MLKTFAYTYTFEHRKINMHKFHIPDIPLVCACMQAHTPIKRTCICTNKHSVCICTCVRIYLNSQISCCLLLHTSLSYSSSKSIDMVQKTPRRSRRITARVNEHMIESAGHVTNIISGLWEAYPFPLTFNKQHSPPPIKKPSFSVFMTEREMISK